MAEPEKRAGASILMPGRELERIGRSQKSAGAGDLTQRTLEASPRILPKTLNSIRMGSNQATIGFVERPCCVPANGSEGASTPPALAQATV